MSDKFALLRAPAALALALAIGGCSGGSGGDSAGNPSMRSDAGTGEQSASSDSFVSRVLGIIGNNSESAEPESVDSITVTTPENREPVPIS